MFCFFYDCLQYMLVLLFMPKFWYEKCFKGKFKKGLKPYLALSLPEKKVNKGPVFLLTAISLGETKAAASLFANMKKSYPEATFYVASRTETGHEEARKSLREADGYFFVPLDFSWSIKRFLNYLEPDIVLVIESDFWYNFFRLSKKRGCKLFLVSGKLSLRSYQRFYKFSFFAKKLLSFFDLLCVQNSLIKERFVNLGVDSSKVIVTGNLKFNTPFIRKDQSVLRDELGIVEGDKVLVIASTHSLEEESILGAIETIWSEFSSLKVIVVPRHPERFKEVKELFLKKNIAFVSYSQIALKTGFEKLILVDAMGILFSLYQIADLAVVGGSFFNYLRGHNIFEPIQAGVPVLFGPFMSDQNEFVERVLSSCAGKQVSLADLAFTIRMLFQDDDLLRKMRKNGDALLQEVEGSSFATWESIHQCIEKV